MLVRVQLHDAVLQKPSSVSTSSASTCRPCVFTATLPARRAFGRIKAHMHVIDAKTELIAQYAGRTNVSGNHRFFDDTVGNATRLGDDIQHFTFYHREIKAVIRAIL